MAEVMSNRSVAEDGLCEDATIVVSDTESASVCPTDAKSAIFRDSIRFSAKQQGVWSFSYRSLGSLENNRFHCVKVNLAGCDTECTLMEQIVYIGHKPPILSLFLPHCSSHMKCGL